MTREFETLKRISAHFIKEHGPIPQLTVEERNFYHRMMGEVHCALAIAEVTDLTKASGLRKRDDIRADYALMCAQGERDKDIYEELERRYYIGAFRIEQILSTED